MNWVRDSCLAFYPKKFSRHIGGLAKSTLLMWGLLSSGLLAQTSKSLPAAQPDSLRRHIIDSTSASSADRAYRKKLTAGVTTPIFFSPAIGFQMDTAAPSKHLFQDGLHLAAQTVPVIPLLTGEVGQPHYWATGDLPPRAVQIVVDDVRWIPGVYGTTDLTGLPDAHIQILQTSSAQFFLSPATIHLASDSLNFSVPFSNIEYAKGPFGADAVRFRFGRAIGKRLAAYLNGTFSNSEGQFAGRPYEGHKANLQLNYFLNANWQLRYRQLNSRNEAGIGVPFFPEEWPGVTAAFHKEERLYHALELTSQQGLQFRSFIWQIKEELKDPALNHRHRLLDGGIELNWERHQKNWALQLQSISGLENIKSTSIKERQRFYQQAGVNYSRRLSTGTWLRLGGQTHNKRDWPFAAALQAQFVAQPNPSHTWWLSGSLWKIAPALSERDNNLPYLKMTGELRAANLQRNELGMKWQHQNLEVQISLNDSRWSNSFVYKADTSKSSGMLFNNAETEFVLATQLAFSWQLAPRWQLGATSTQVLNGLPPDFWFWHQPEGYSRVYLETQKNIFGGDLELLPRLAARLVGKRYSPSFATTAVQVLDDHLPATAVLDFQIRLRHGDGAFLFSWENVFNKRFDWRHSVPAVGRYLRWGFGWNFLN